VPLFPLPHLWLFPSVVLPLQIFEPRYKQMLEDQLDGPGRLVLGTIQAGHEDEAAGSPPVYPVAGLGEIVRHERLEDGRFMILLLGLKRVLLREVPSDRLYREVEVHEAPEVPVAPQRERALAEELRAGLESREVSPIPAGFSISNLTDMLILRLALPHEVVNRLYCELDAEKRARAALAQHELRPGRGSA